MSGLKVVALVSGGKDSFFSILHCLANGHDLVALANLHPPAKDGEQSEDIDSFMYQTVGHAVIPLYEKALGLPLYRQEILGSAIDSNKNYATPSQVHQYDTATADETESLLPLLRKVKAAHPEINAVSTGAILSDYQRTRVESVAVRLGLTPLSYLWQYPFLPPYSETSLLDDMCAVGQDARIIKVASGGLDESFLWENVANMRTKAQLVRAMQRFGTLGDGAAVGEGGEFETLAIDGPWPLWKSSIQILPEDTITLAGDAGVASLKIKNARLVAKDAPESSSTAMTSVLEKLRRPPMLDEAFVAIQSAVESGARTAERQGEDQVYESANDHVSFETWTTRGTGNTAILSNCIDIDHSTHAGDQMKTIMDRIVDEFGIKTSSIAFATILLRDMSDFGAVNAAYGSRFTAPNPPARVTIACGNALPEGVNVLLSIIYLKGASQEAKRGLHVQSRSYWAPANIGPYSQAISIPTGEMDDDSEQASTVYVAGQIPLVPTSMDFPQQGSCAAETHFREQAILSLQHLWRIGQITNVKLWLGAVAFIARRSEVPVTDRVQTALRAWKLAHSSPDEATSDEDEDEDVDVWDRAHGHHQSYGVSAGTQTKRPSIQNELVPPCFVAEVEELPRNAPIEWASIGARISSHDFKMKGKSYQVHPFPSTDNATYQRTRLQLAQTRVSKSQKRANIRCQHDGLHCITRRGRISPLRASVLSTTIHNGRESTQFTPPIPFHYNKLAHWIRRSYPATEYGMLTENLYQQSSYSDPLENALGNRTRTSRIIK